jgi:hypothetical protein
VVAIVSTFHTILGQKQHASADQNSCSRSQSASRQTGLAGGRLLQAIRAKRVKETLTTMASKYDNHEEITTGKYKAKKREQEYFQKKIGKMSLFSIFSFYRHMYYRIDSLFSCQMSDNREG